MDWTIGPLDLWTIFLTIFWTIFGLNFGLFFLRVFQGGGLSYVLPQRGVGGGRGGLVNFVVMVNKIDGQTRLLRFVPFVHLLFIFRSFDFFVASLLLMKGISYCVIRRKARAGRSC